MHKIRDWLYIGKYRETINLPLLHSYGITAMLHLADTVHHEGIESLCLVIDDGVPVKQEILQQGIDFIINQKNQDKTVMSACGAGISRSTTFAMGALMQAENLDLWDAYQSILEVHPDAFPAPDLLVSLSEYFEQPIEKYPAAEQTMMLSIERKRRG